MKQLHLLVVTLFLLMGCGKEDRADNGQNRATIEYFNNFVTKADGKDRDNSERLQANGIYNTSGFVGFSQNTVVLDLDSNGQFSLYTAPKDEFFRPINLINESGIQGAWVIENNKLILENVGESLEFSESGLVFNQFPVGTGVQGGLLNNVSFTAQCFPLRFISSLNLGSNTLNSQVPNQFTDLNTVQVTAGTVYQFCLTPSIQ